MSFKGTKFVLFSDVRVGSTWLMDTLDYLEGVNGHGELFLPEKRVWDVGPTDTPRYIEWTPNRPKIRPFSTFSFLDYVYNRPGANGFKFKYGTLLIYPEVWFYFCLHRVRVVHLVRRNHLKALISLELAKKTGKWHSASAGKSPSQATVWLNPNTIVKKIDRRRKNIELARRLLSWFRLPCLEIAYEDLLNGLDGFQAVWRFLSVNPGEQMPRSNLQILDRGRYAERIANCVEITRVLRDSVFAELLDETFGVASCA